MAGNANAMATRTRSSGTSAAAASMSSLSSTLLDAPPDRSSPWALPLTHRRVGVGFEVTRGLMLGDARRVTRSAPIPRDMPLRTIAPDAMRRGRTHPTAVAILATPGAVASVMLARSCFVSG